MPAIITRTVNSISAGGSFDGYYTSLSAWEAGEQGDLTALDQIHQAECYAFNDTAQVTVSGWTMDATRYARIYAHASGRHAGKWDAAKYNLTVTDNIALNIQNVTHVRVEGLQIRIISPTGNYQAGVGFGNCGSCDMRLSSCIIRVHGDPTYVVFGVYGDSNPTLLLKIWNNLIYGLPVNGTGSGINPAIDTGIAYIYNNTVILPLGDSNLRGIAIPNPSVAISKNNLVKQNGGTTEAFHVDSGGTLTNTNCASSDATAGNFGGSGNRVTQTFSFVNEGSDDYHLASGDAGAKGFGANLSGDANLPFSDDIDGDTRSAPWDIGADAIASAISTMNLYYRRKR